MCRLIENNVCYLALKTVKINGSDDDIVEIMKLESDEDDRIADKPSSKSKPVHSSLPGPWHTIRKFVL